MESRSPSNRMVCRYCGLDSGVSPNHATARDCIVALEREANQLREVLLHCQPRVTIGTTPARGRLGIARVREG
jgi:hypothetical protein